MNNAVFSEASDIDYFIINFDESVVTPEWIVKTYSQRNWLEVVYREAKSWLGLKEYQTRGKRSLDRHLILVFCAYTFILWHQLTRKFIKHKIAMVNYGQGAVKTSKASKLFFHKFLKTYL